ncbi:hypothetical protein [Rhodococcus spongiicola]|nr:hypothetical protein [Rhodococcus spongiicola]
MGSTPEELKMIDDASELLGNVGSAISGIGTALGLISLVATILP